MPRIVHYQFIGSWLVFGFLFLTGIGLPFAILYLLERIVRTDTEVDNPEESVAALRSGGAQKGAQVSKAQCLLLITSLPSMSESPAPPRV